MEDRHLQAIDGRVLGGVGLLGIEVAVAEGAPSFWASLRWLAAIES